VEQEGVDAIVCGGDVVGGPFPAEVLDRLTSRNARFLRGNVDRFTIEGSDEFDHDWTAERERLGGARVETLRAWPLTVELDIEGLGRTLFCHAVPSADEPIFTRITPDEEVVDLLGDVAADLVVCGHTHVQFDRRLPNGLRVVNAGSVGMPYEGSRGAFWALLGPDVELRRTEYDTDAAVAAMRQAGAPADAQFLGWLLDPPDPDESSAFFEAQRSGSGGS
jgi:diadenosine tetraphosphatase ApaH/serine/threonine PP2A family protein phosphatase